ncbi:phosphotransferase enzyme family protein [Bifidobacterium aquikefiricola]|uniref:Phosphotransferase n=1 Tax=Bifidobacterium aquikefiricola TaxID=3059038 RepID=A0AB39U8N9_9BIFI
MALLSVSENATYMLRDANDERFVIRVSRPGYVSGASSIESEMLWVQELDQCSGIKVIQPVPKRDGSLVATVADDSHHVWFCVCTRWIQGEILDIDRQPLNSFFALGSISAQLHEYARSWKPPEWFQRFSWDIPDMIGPRARWGDWSCWPMNSATAQLLALAQRHALDILAEYPRSRDRWGLIHADLRLSNVMYTDDSYTVIDFDDCGYGWFMFDFASSLSMLEHTKDATRLAREWLKGYESVRHLDSDDIAAATALSMLRRLQILGWSQTRGTQALPTEFVTTQLSGTVEVAKKYLNDPLWIVHR